MYGNKARKGHRYLVPVFMFLTLLKFGTKFEGFGQEKQPVSLQAALTTDFIHGNNNN